MSSSFQNLLWIPISTTVKGLTHVQGPTQFTYYPSKPIDYLSSCYGSFQVHQPHCCSSDFPGKVQWVLCSDVLSASDNLAQTSVWLILPPPSNLYIYLIFLMGSTLIIILNTGSGLSCAWIYQSLSPYATSFLSVIFVTF